MFAEIASQYIEADLAAVAQRALIVERTTVALREDDALRTVFQPMVTLTGGEVEGVEALSRFSLPPARTPDVWFAEATSVGLGVDLEIRAVQGALAALERLSEGVFLAVNLSPRALLSGRADDLLLAAPDRIVLEMTEHAPIADYAELRRALGPLRRSG